MQTFFPFSTAIGALNILDNRRLGKQRVEGYQILNTLTGRSRGWLGHPAVRMWRGHEAALLDYTLTACEFWVERGFTDTLSDKLFEEYGDIVYAEDHPIIYPSWTERQAVLDSHKAMLYHKDPVHYALFEPFAHITEYVWPV